MAYTKLGRVVFTVEHVSVISSAEECLIYTLSIWHRSFLEEYLGLGLLLKGKCLFGSLFSYLHCRTWQISLKLIQPIINNGHDSRTVGHWPQSLSGAKWSKRITKSWFFYYFLCLFMIRFSFYWVSSNYIILPFVTDSDFL